VSAFPSDFWANVEMGNALLGPKPAEAIGYYRTALALRPRTVALHYTLCVLYFDQKRFDECLAHGRHAVRLAPDDAWCHTALAAGLATRLGGEDEAVAELREAIRLDPGHGLAHRNLAVILELCGRPKEAVDEYRHAIRLHPEVFAQDRGRLRKLLLKLGRCAEALPVWKEELAAKPRDHDAWFGYPELCLFLGEQEEYRRARRELLARFGDATDPLVVARVGRACLLLPAAKGELRKATALTERGLAADPMKRGIVYPYLVLASGLADYRRGRWKDALAAMRGKAADTRQGVGPSALLIAGMALHRMGQKAEARKALAEAVTSYDWSEAATDHGAWMAHVLRREAEALMLPGLPAFLAGKYQPTDNDERLALVGACQCRGLRAAEAHLMAAAFEADPKRPGDPSSGLYFRAACAAAVVGTGGGTDSAGLGEQERLRWRKQARLWLRLELTAWAKRLDAATADSDELQTAMKCWRDGRDLAGVRDEGALKKLPPDERQQWQALWQEVASLLRRAESAR
jgi:serine/threonine-protein kinase